MRCWRRAIWLSADVYRRQTECPLVAISGLIGVARRTSALPPKADIRIATRLEGVNKIYGSTILVNEVTKELCGPGIAFREVDIVRVKGRDAPVRIFEPLGKSEDIDEQRARALQVFAEALASFRRRRFEEAASGFDSLAEHDPVARCFAERARELEAHPPPAYWDGVNTLLSK